MKDYQINPKTIKFAAAIEYDSSIIKASYDIFPLACFVAEEMDEEMLAEAAYNEISENIRDTQLNLSYLYIAVLELIEKGKINRHHIGHFDNLMSVSNQLEFLSKLGRAFQGVSVEIEKTKNSK